MYKQHPVIHIVACNLNNAIGENNRLLYYIKGDLQHFKKTTNNSVCLVGANTYKTLPALKNRILLCVDRKHSLEQSLEHASYLCKNENDTIYVIGGAKLYNSTFNIADKLIVTEIKDDKITGDTFYNIPDNFYEISRSSIVSCSGYDYYISTYRNSNIK